MQEGAAGSALPGTTVSRAVAEDAVAMGESRSRSKSRSRLRARSRSLLESVAALWFSREAIACLLAITVLRVLHLVASGAFIFFRGGVAVAASPVAVAVAGEGAAVAEAPAVVLAAASPVKGAAVAEAPAVVLAAAAPVKGTYVTVPTICVLSPGADPFGLTSSSVTIESQGILLIPVSVKIPPIETPHCTCIARSSAWGACFFGSR